MDHFPRRRRRRRPTTLLLLLLSLLALFTLTFADDAAVMHKLAAALGPAGWSSTGDPCADKWPDLNCNAGRVVAINLASAKVSGNGPLPADLNLLSELHTLSLQNNGIIGSLPSLSGLSNLQEVYLDGNNFTSIPPDFFAGLTSLRFMSLNGNRLAPWTIPDDVAKCTSLNSFYASGAGVTGVIPAFFGELANLVSLRLSYNNLSGTLPESFAGSSLQNMWLNNQQSPDKLTGNLNVLSTMNSLTQVWLHGNSFTGPVPDLENCTDLFDLQIRDNELTGVLPQSLFNMPKLVNISLGHNMLQGPFPSFKSGVIVDDNNLGRNNFCDNKPGPCDPQVLILLSVEQGFGYPVKLAESWTGNDPCNGWSFVSCDAQKKNVSVLSLSDLGLSGTISPEIAKLTSLKTILLSNNNLTGAIPGMLTSLQLLQTFDVSNNNLSGEVPVFAKSVKFNVTGNPLIGKVLPPEGPGSPSSPASGVDGKRSSSMPLKVVVAVVLAIVAAIGMVIALLRFRKSKKGKVLSHFPLSSIDLSNGNGKGKGKAVIPVTNGGMLSSRSTTDGGNGSLALSFTMLKRATNGFKEENVVGRGGYGVVYKGVLEDGAEIAVKRTIKLGDSNGMDEFKAEIAVLTKVRHRHLVALLGYCVQDNERLLVYEFMPQGTLGQHLFEYKEHNWQPLTWMQRLVIALDVARGVEYLHSLAQQIFIHRDLKPSNILLGNDMRAKVSDFGLVKSADFGKDSIKTKVAGTFGYLAPECFHLGRFTTKCDVYSVGVILVELIVGRSAVDEFEPDHKIHITQWINRMKRTDLTKAIDPAIKYDDETLKHIRVVVELAGHCSASNPDDRPDMAHVVSVLSPLVETWKPSSSRADEGHSMEFSLGLPEMIQQWKDGYSIGSDSRLTQFGRSGDTQTSTDPPSSAFPTSLTSNIAR